MSSLHKHEKLLFDILQAARFIQDFTTGLNKASFLENECVLSACERKFEIIGEALNRLKRNFPNVAKTVPELEKIISFRHLIAHGYDVVDPEIVWDAVENSIPI